MRSVEVKSTLETHVTPKVLPSHLHVRRPGVFFVFSAFWSQLFVKDIGICQLISWKYCTATSTDASFLYSAAYGFVSFLLCTEIYNSDGGLPSLCLDRELWNHLQGVVEFFDSIDSRQIALSTCWEKKTITFHHEFQLHPQQKQGIVWSLHRDVPHTQPAKVCLVGQHGCDFVDLWPCQGNSMQQLSTAISGSKLLTPKMDVSQDGCLKIASIIEYLLFLVPLVHKF